MVLMHSFSSVCAFIFYSLYIVFVVIHILDHFKIFSNPLTMTSLIYGRVFCLESQKIDGTEYLRGSTDLVILFLLLNLEA